MLAKNNQKNNNFNTSVNFKCIYTRAVIILSEKIVLRGD